MSVLEASYVVYRLRSYHRNFNKRLVKSPKLYFHDTGLACSLLGIRDAAQVTTHFLKGALFENLILNEFVKRSLHAGRRDYPYFWRDSRGNEIDCLLVDGTRLALVEMKAGKTVSDGYFRNIRFWRQLQTDLSPEAYVVYGGDPSLQMQNGRLLSWRNLDQIT